MEIKKIEKQEEKLNETEVSDLFKAIIEGKDITEQVKTKKGIFEIKFPRIKDLEAIGRLTAYRLNGLSAKSFDPDTYSLIQKIAALDILTVKGPGWYELAKKNQINFGWSDIPSQSLLEEVYASAYNFRIKVQREIESDKKPTDREVATLGNIDNPDEPNLFEGLST